MISDLSSIIVGLKIINPKIFRDFRGEYIETYNKRDWNLEVDFVQDDISVSSKHVLRGLHGDAKTYKLVQCLYGFFYLAVVDCRKDSKTYGNFIKFALSDKNRRQVFIPKGCANGHLCVSETCIFHYKQSEYYEGADKQFTLRWNALPINWTVDNPILSERDANGLELKDIEL